MEIYWNCYALTFVIAGKYDDAVKGLKRAEDDISLETETDDAPRRRKLPSRYIDSDEDNEDKENNMLSRKEKGPRKRKVRKLSESDDESGSKTLPQVNSDVLNAVKENSIHVHQVQDKEREKMPRRQPLEKNIEFRLLQKFEDNSSQGRERKQRQLQKVRDSQSQSIICKRNEKWRKIDYTKRKKCCVSNSAKQKLCNNIFE